MQVPFRAISAVALILAYNLLFLGHDSPLGLLAGNFAFLLAALATYPFAWLLTESIKTPSLHIHDLMLLGIAGMFASHWLTLPMGIFFAPYALMALAAALHFFTPLATHWTYTTCALSMGALLAHPGLVPQPSVMEHLGFLALLAISAFVLLAGGTILASFFAAFISIIDAFCPNRITDSIGQALPTLIRAAYAGLSIAVVAVVAFTILRP